MCFNEIYYLRTCSFPADHVVSNAGVSVWVVSNQLYAGELGTDIIMTFYVELSVLV